MYNNPCENHIKPITREILISNVPTTYLHFCTMGGLSNPLCRKVQLYNGKHHYGEKYYVDSYRD